MNYQLRAELYKPEHAKGFELREADALEIFRQTLCDPVFAVRNALSCKFADIWTVLDRKDNVVCFFGASPMSQFAESAVAFALTSKYANLYPSEFALRGRKIAKGLIRKYGYLFNKVDAEYKECHKWLEFCGFKVEYNNPETVNGYKFYPFHGGKLDV